MDTNTSLQINETLLPPGFQYSQGSLQAFVDCPRLFQLRYIQNVSWPAPEAEPSMQNEDYLQKGIAFHHMAHQYFLGISTDHVEQYSDQDSQLTRWWQDFLESKSDMKDYAKYPEFSLSIPLGDERLVAKFDLLAILNQPSENTATRKRIARIFDWKTSRRRPKDLWQENRLQSQVYPYLLVKASAYILGGIHLEPEQVEMVYWFSNFPTLPLRITYDREKFEAGKKLIKNLIKGTKKIGLEDAPKTENIKRCRYCVYRSLCNRGTTAGSLEEDLDIFQAEKISSDDLAGFDFDQIAEIEF